MAGKRRTKSSTTAAARAEPSTRREFAEGSDAASISKPPPGSSSRSKPNRGLVVIATPIGNADDITLRALAGLREADVIACEDTRVTGKLMARHGVATPLVAFHEHNAARMRPLLLARLARGETVALVSDAGTPLVSDPGYKLVRAAIAADIAVTTLPGASAPLAALVVSGMPTDRFLFAGFLPPRSAGRRAALADLVPVRASLVFFESAGRLAESLADMAAMLGRRDAAVARELTKLFEEVRRGALADLAAHYADAGPPKGEIVIVVAPPAQDAAIDESLLDAALDRALAQMSLRDAVAAVTAATGLPRRTVYARALARSATDAGAPCPRPRPDRSAGSPIAAGGAAKRWRSGACASRATASWRETCARRSARSTSSPVADACWRSSRSRRAIPPTVRSKQYRRGSRRASSAPPTGSSPAGRSLPALPCAST